MQRCTDGVYGEIIEICEEFSGWVVAKLSGAKCEEASQSADDA